MGAAVALMSLSCEYDCVRSVFACSSFFNIHTSLTSLFSTAVLSTFIPADETFFFNPNVDNQLYKQIPTTSVAVAASTSEHHCVDRARLE